MEDSNAPSHETIYGVMTEILEEILDKMLKAHDIHIPYLEVPVKESIYSERSLKFFNALYELMDIPEAYRNLDKLLELNPGDENEKTSSDQSDLYSAD